MAIDVNDNSADLTLRAARIADTEAKVLRAAAELFVGLGYSATTLRAVAKAAGVGERTVYVRFGTKAALLKRVIDVAVVGDTEPVDVMGREWFQRSVTAPTAAERIAAAARGGREIMQRAGALIGVAVQAEAIEALIAAAAQAGREATRDTMRLFWTRMAEDGLLPAGADVEWLGDTASLLGSPHTYLLMTQTLGWDFGAYEKWLRTTWTRLAAASGNA
jgi:AcrR family transcriptional regulator